MGNHNSTPSADQTTHPLGKATQWKARAPGEARRALLCSLRRLTVAKMLHERLGDGAIWLEGELLEIIIQLIPVAGMCISVGGASQGCECTTIAAGLEAAQPGDTIKLLPGVYREPIVLQPSPSNVTVVGAGTRPSDVVVIWGDDGAEDAGVTSVHNAGDVIERGATSEYEFYRAHQSPEDGPVDILERALGDARATLAALQQGDVAQARTLSEQQNLQSLTGVGVFRSGSGRVQWVKYCSPFRSHASGATVKNLTLRGTGNSPAVYAETGGLVMEDVVVEGAAVLETHSLLRRCRVEPGVSHGVGVCVPICHSNIVLENCLIKDCLLGLAISYAEEGYQTLISE